MFDYPLPPTPENSLPPNVGSNLQNELTVSLKTHIDNLDEHYQNAAKQPLSRNSHKILALSLDEELETLIVTFDLMQKAHVITFRQSLSCTLLLAEIKSNFLKIDRVEEPTILVNRSCESCLYVKLPKWCIPCCACNDDCSNYEPKINDERRKLNHDF